MTVIQSTLAPWCSTACGGFVPPRSSALLVHGAVHGKRSEDRAGSDGLLLCIPCTVGLSACDSSEMNGIALAHLGGVRVINTSLRGL